jgi:uncharacterized protein (TIGR02145 family)
MAENLKVMQYRNGDSIPNITDDYEWIKQKSGAWSYYNNIPERGEIFGLLYNWYTIRDSRDVAPEGWHVPSDAEFRTMIDYLGGAAVAGGKMKEAGTAHWFSPNLAATNESGFTALGAGARVNFLDSCRHLYQYTSYWTSTVYADVFAWLWLLHCDYSEIFTYNHEFIWGLSIRCVKD